MPPSKHPTYPQSTIHEAVCEVRFSTGRPWEHALSGELFKAVQNEYPTMEPVVQLGVQLEIGPQGLVQTAGPRPLTRYRHREKASLLQLTENSFAISFLSPYPGWQVMKQDFLSAWDLASRALKPERITRVGLRYINRLPVVLTTNLALEEIDPRLRSRISDPGLVDRVYIQAPDYRRPLQEGSHGAVV